MNTPFKPSIEATVAMSCMFDGDPELLKRLLIKLENKEIESSEVAIQYSRSIKDGYDACINIVNICNMIKPHVEYMRYVEYQNKGLPFY